MGNSSLDRERRRKDSVEIHTLSTRIEEVSNPRVELLSHRRRVWRARQDDRLYRKLKMCLSDMEHEAKWFGFGSSSTRSVLEPDAPQD